MNSLILGLLAETSIHPGAGQSAGFVDLPVAREAATDYPVIVGSSVKGALLDMARNTQLGVDEPTRKRVFGEQDIAGTLLVSDIRLLLLPVRSLKSQYKWLTCPHLIERLARDLRRSSVAAPDVGIQCVADGKYLGENENDLFLEERQFQFSGKLPTGLVDQVQSLIPHADSQQRVAQQLVVLSDRDFSWFARFGLAVTARNVLNPETKSSNNLWYEETIPPDSVFYGLFADRGGRSLDVVETMFAQRPYLQVGGNETVGQGWFAVKILKNKGGAA